MKDNERYLRIIKDGKRAILDFDLDLSTKAQTNEENMKMRHNCHQVQPEIR